MSTELMEVTESVPPDLAVSRAPAIVLHEAMEAAKALQEVISKKKKPVLFGGEQYIEFEDWMTIGRFYGVTVKVVSTAPIELGPCAGFEAAAVVINTSGREISRAEAMCLNDEANWRNKPLFQLRSMAQTRACAKALRNVLSWVVVLAGYKPTPAEEMDGVFKGQDTASTPPKETKKGKPITNFPAHENYGAVQGKVIADCTIPELERIGVKIEAWSHAEDKKEFHGYYVRLLNLVRDTLASKEA